MSNVISKYATLFAVKKAYHKVFSAAERGTEPALKWLKNFADQQTDLVLKDQVNQFAIMEGTKHGK